MPGKTRLEIGTILFSQMKQAFLLDLEKQRFGREEEKKFTLERGSIIRKIHVWGCFSSKGFGRIVLFRENLISKKLIDIYEEGLLPSAKEFKINSWILFGR